MAKLLGEDFLGRDALRAQWQSALVRRLDDDGCLEIRAGVDTAACPSPYRVPVEGSWPDDNKVMAAVLLHLDDDGYLHELEFVQNPGGCTFGELDPATMWVFAPPWRPDQ